VYIAGLIREKGNNRRMHNSGIKNKTYLLDEKEA